MGSIRVTPEEMQATAAQFANRASELESLMSQIQSQIESLSSTWQGAAASQFTELMAKWGTDTQGIREVLGTVSDHLNRAAQAYADAENAIRQGFTAQ